MQGPGPGVVGVAPTFHLCGDNASTFVQLVADDQRCVVDRVTRGQVRIVLGAPVDTVAGKQRRRYPDALGGGPRGRASGDIWTVSLDNRDQTQDLPAHRPESRVVLIGPREQAA